MTIPEPPEPDTEVPPGLQPPPPPPVNIDPGNPFMLEANPPSPPPPLPPDPPLLGGY